MKKADDFRKAFGPATPGFESVVKKTIKELRAQEIKPVVKEWRRWRRPVFAMAMVLVLFIGFVAVNGTINPFNRRDLIRSEEENLYTAQPITTVLSMGAGQEEGDGDGAESGLSEGRETLSANADKDTRHELWCFFSSWAQDPETAVFSFTEEWKDTEEHVAEALKILGDEKPLSYRINSISGKEGDPEREAVCTAEMELGKYQQFTLKLRLEEETYYDIDPEGLKNRKPVTADLSAEMISLSEESITKAELDRQAPGLSAKMIPVNQVCEKQGLRVEVVSGYVSGKECGFVISIQDPEGKYKDYVLSALFESDVPGSSGYTAIPLYSNEAEYKEIYLLQPTINNPVPAEDRTITVGVDSFRMEEHKAIDLLPLLKQYGKTVEGVGEPSQLVIPGPTVKYPPSDMKYLDYTQPLDIPLFGDVCLSGIGWIDGQLHVQYHYTGEEMTINRNGVTYSGIWEIWNYINADQPEYSGVQWDANYDCYAEWEEAIYNVGPEEIDGLVLNAGIWTLKDVLADGWMVEIPLKAVCPDVLELDPEIEERVNGFMTAWSSLDYDGMLALCDPEWKESTGEPLLRLENLIQNAILLDSRCVSIVGKAEDTVRTLICATNIQRPGNMPHTSFRLNVEVKKAADGLWYINPESLKNWIVTEDIRVEPVENAPVERLEEDFGNISLEEREGKITFDVYANTDVYTKNGIGYALMEDGTAEAVATSILASDIDEIEVPEKVNGHVVTTIGTGAFMDYSMKSVTLPDTVKSIKSCAFEDCDKLQYLRIPDGVTAIEASVFLNCISLTEVAIPDSVTVIGDQAFKSCRSLAGVRIPEGTVEIGNYAFLGCEGLTSVTLPEGLDTLGDYAFSKCIGLEAVDVPGSVTYIGQGAFKDCTGLQIVRIREGITHLNPDVFAGCIALETVDLPESLGSISDRAFRECGSLKKLVLPEGLKSIGRAAFMNCTSLEELVIPESVIYMDENVFKDCTGLICTVKDGSYAMSYCEENGIRYVVR